jgi:DNA repair protein RadC
MQTQSIRSEDQAAYIVGKVEGLDDESIIRHALDILTRRVNAGPIMESPIEVKNFFLMRAAGLEREEFSVMFLDVHHRVIATDTMFTGTLSQASVYPREVVKRALHHNASAVILSHNHPSGGIQPSRADEHLTQSLKSALALVDVRVLDHVIVGACSVGSMAEQGLI